MSLFSVENKIAVVTGAARGLGFAYTKALLSNGVKVIICDLHEESVYSAVSSLSSYGEVFGIKADVSNESDIQEMATIVLQRYGRIDILVNNAGICQRTITEEMSPEEWDRVMSVNVKGTFLCCRYFGPHMIRQRSGKIVNVSSIAGRIGLDLRLAYCTSKAAIEHLTRTLASQWGSYNINVNAIGPGFIKTNMNEDLRADPAMYKKMVEQVPMNRFGEPEELTGTLLYLVSSASDYVNGQTIFVDGGLLSK